jgi:hypothetical protein
MPDRLNTGMPAHSTCPRLERQVLGAKGVGAPRDACHPGERARYLSRSVSRLFWPVHPWVVTGIRGLTGLAADGATRLKALTGMYWSACQEALAAETMYADLSPVSEAELTRRDLTRDVVHKLVLAGLSPGAGGSADRPLRSAHQPPAGGIPGPNPPIPIRFDSRARTRRADPLTSESNNQRYERAREAGEHRPWSLRPGPRHIN